MNAPTIATELAQRITALRYDDLPSDAVHWAKVAIIDTLACALAGANEAGPRIAQKVARVYGAGGTVSLWGTDRRASALDAALINGTAGHALDYDDVNNTIGGHPSVPLLPAIIALGEMTGASGRDVLLAYVTGFEAQAAIGKAVNVYHYRKGWHPTATLGVFGAAAACARLLNLDVARTATALAIAASLSSGIKANFGTMVKPLHAGHCSRNGLYAALMAKESFTAADDALEHHQGFFEMFNGAGNYDAQKALTTWANPLDLLNPGIGLKQYPCCASTHSAIDAALILRERHQLTPERIAKIETVTHAPALAHTNRPDPKTALDAKFSVQYCVARALMHGAVTFDHFEDDALIEPRLRALLSRVTANTHPNAPKDMAEHYQGVVNVTTTEGKTYSARVDQPLRGPRNLAPPDRLESKFKDCASRALRPDALPRLYEMLTALETLANVGALTDFMAAAANVAGGGARRAAA
ncbi:MAG: MmgE/PrpD family protein [Betaproteobacteria bacterium]|nr:MmgE/PrpD family protein [Betaproteobacteria bacterium]